MRNISLHIIMMISATVALTSCEKSLDKDVNATDPNQDLITDVVNINMPEATKTTIGEGNTVAWENGDIVYYWSAIGAQTSTGYTAERHCTKVESNKVTLTRNTGDSFYAILYGGDDAKRIYVDGEDTGTNLAVRDYTVTSFYFSGINPTQTGKFSFANIAVGYIDLSGDNTMPSACTLKNITSILKFNLPANNNVKSVTMESNNKASGNEINGRIEVDLTADNPAATYKNIYPKMDGYQWTTTIAESNIDATNARTYYIGVMPGTKAGGFTLTMPVGSYTTKVAKASNDVTFTAGKIKNVGDPTAKATATTVISIADIVTANSWANDTRYYSWTADELKIEAKSTNNGACIGGAGWRTYQTKSNGEFTITAPSGKNISSITMTYSVKNSGTLKYGDTTLTSGTAQTFDDSSNTRTFTVGNSDSATDGSVNISAMTVIYK